MQVHGYVRRYMMPWAKNDVQFRVCAMPQRANPRLSGK